MNSPVQAQACLKCQTVMPGNAYFCYNCGKSLRKLPPSSSVSRQITIYLTSFFVPPSGFLFGWQYIRQPDEKLKMIGVVAVILTVGSLLLSLWTFKALISFVYSQLGVINSLSL